MPGQPTKSWRSEHLFVAALALALVAFGGSSRADMIQQAPLRAACALLLVPAIYLAWTRGIGSGGALLTMLGAIIVLTALQLVPLPPAMWQSLPARDVIARIDYAAGLGDIWRPLTMTPGRTANALAAMIVPLTALLLALATRMSARNLLVIIAWIAVMNFVLGMMQIVNPGNGNLFFYSITNPGTAVGIFANNNHAAVLSACAMLIFTRLAIEDAEARSPSPWLLVFVTGAVAMFFSAIVNGSRAGFIAALVGSLTAAAMTWVMWSRRGKKLDRHSPVKNRSYKGALIAGGLVAFIAALLATLSFAGNLDALDRLSDDSALQDVRVGLLPILRQMATALWFTGSGFGSFELVYHVFEPDSMLASHVINQAHNDWVQLVIEGGLVAALLLLALMIWIARSIIRLIRAPQVAGWLPLFWTGTFAIIAFASLVDYPMRAPTFTAVAVFLLIVLMRDATEAGRFRDNGVARH